MDAPCIPQASVTWDQAIFPSLTLRKALLDVLRCLLIFLGQPGVLAGHRHTRLGSRHGLLHLSQAPALLGFEAALLAGAELVNTGLVSVFARRLSQHREESAWMLVAAVSG